MTIVGLPELLGDNLPGSYEMEEIFFSSSRGALPLKIRAGFHECGGGYLFFKIIVGSGYLKIKKLKKSPEFSFFLIFRIFKKLLIIGS
jgi:hypothetical protein